MKIFAPLVAALALTFAAPSESAAQTVVDQTYAGGEFVWDRNGSGLLYRYRPYVVDGEIVICGAWTRRGSVTNLSRQAMREAHVVIDGQRVMRDVSWFRTVNRSGWQSGLEGMETSCRAMGVAATNSNVNTVTIEFREGRYRG